MDGFINEETMKTYKDMQPQEIECEINKLMNELEKVIAPYDKTIINYAMIKLAEELK